MEAIILAGGLGTRLRSVVSDKPKALAPINGRPFLKLLLEQLSNKGFSRVILATGYLGGQILSVIGRNFAGMSIEYSQEDEPLGTGGALAKAMAKCSQNCVFAINGDTWLDLDFHGAFSFWRQTGGIVIVGIYQEDVSRYGKLEIVDGQIVNLGEKNAAGSGWVNGGCYILPVDLFATKSFGSVFSFERDFLPAYLQKKSAWLFPSSGYFQDIGIPEDYKIFAGSWEHMQTSGH